MLTRLPILLVAFLICTGVYAIEKNDSIVKSTDKSEVPLLRGPSVGLGVGMFKFYGDILDANYGNPLISNIGYDLHIKQQLNSFLTVKFYVLFGTLSANERSTNRNLNFRSNITVGGFGLMYNFDHFLPKNRIISPFVSLGVESVEFLSKTDLYDEFGSEYNYWSDGSIKNIAENDPNAASAVVIQRDYNFETDLRDLDVDGFGKYPERTFAVPLGIGAVMQLTNSLDFTIGTALHFTFTDVIDNVTSESVGPRIGSQEGNNGRDKFLMSSFSISYNFLKHGKPEEIKEFEEDIDYLAYDAADEDADGVIDFIDECPWTPEGVEVDEKGCPLDDDADFVPNYKDDELETREGAPVTPNGVEMTDTMIYIAYQKYLDSTGVFADIETTIVGSKKSKKKRYRIQVGGYTESIDADLVDKFLSIPDVEIKTFGDSLTIIAVGNYDNLPDALKRKIQLTSEGFDGAIVVEEEKNGTFTSVGDAANNMSVDNIPSAPINSRGLIFRVQLGAFSKRLSKDYLNGLKNIMEIKADDGLWKYLYKGSFRTVNDAIKKKLDLAIDYGVEDAFIVAYKNGKRIPLSKAGVENSGVEKMKPAKEEVYNKEDISFKILIGSYQNQLPTDVLSKIMELDGVEQVEIEGGLTRYTVGKFTDFDESEKFRNSVIDLGFGSAFIIAFNKDEVMSIDKAKEILSK